MADTTPTRGGQDFAWFAKAQEILDAANVPLRDRIFWDGKRFTSDNPKIEAKLNAESNG